MLDTYLVLGVMWLYKVVAWGRCSVGGLLLSLFVIITTITADFTARAMFSLAGPRLFNCTMPTSKRNAGLTSNGLATKGVMVTSGGITGGSAHF